MPNTLSPEIHSAKLYKKQFFHIVKPIDTAAVAQHANNLCFLYYSFLFYFI